MKLGTEEVKIKRYDSNDLIRVLIAVMTRHDMEIRIALHFY